MVHNARMEAADRGGEMRDRAEEEEEDQDEEMDFRGSDDEVCGLLHSLLTILLTLVACFFVFHVAISPQGDDGERSEFLSQAREKQPAAKKRRQGALKADALLAAHVRLFGDGGSVAPVRRTKYLLHHYTY